MHRAPARARTTRWGAEGSTPFGLGIGAVDRGGRGRAARVGGAARVHARRRHGEPRAAAAGPRPAGGARSCSARRRTTRCRPRPECVDARRAAGQGPEHAVVHAYRIDIEEITCMTERSGRPTATRSWSTRGLRKTFEAEGAPVRALRGVDLDDDARRVRRGHGPVGLRQVDAAQPRRRARHADRRRDRRSRARQLVGKTEDELARHAARATSASCSSSSTCSRA